MIFRQDLDKIKLTFFFFVYFEVYLFLQSQQIAQQQLVATNKREHQRNLDTLVLNLIVVFKQLLSVVIKYADSLCQKKFWFVIRDN